MHLISIITVNYNQPDVTEALLQSVISKNDYPEIQMIVVDNGSNTNPIEAWKTKYPWVYFIRSEKNLGFAGGNNLGIREATGDYLFLINNDTEITPGLIGHLAGQMERNPQIGIISPKIKYFDEPDILQYAGFTSMNYYNARNRCIGQFEKDNGQYDHLTGKTGFAHGAAMMVRKCALKKAGLMPEQFFLYYEELDWCDHFKRAGYEIWVDMQAVIYHKESISVGKNSMLKTYFMNRNRVLYIRRNAPFFKRLVFYMHFLLIVTPRNIFSYLIKNNVAHIGIMFRSIWWNFTNDSNSNYIGYPTEIK
ncbi:glycosyltransferase family 2 protein [uncultured Mucilaginibacter sp.]|uniref:glycosyltransferase family 2 protein n=1 Tax=uncultured Mucilaginibacter sp. TaxID=797541 RepID=UPI0026274884|nr:glycosyltransferase family 2 protein [uncultured Mucilaginibacter sp.]